MVFVFMYGDSNSPARRHRSGSRIRAVAHALGELHAAQTRSVPFEDYDIHTGTPISLRVPDLFDKIVRRKRGGFCYELNGLFAALLIELGFKVIMVSAFEIDHDGRRGPDFDHMRLLVRASDGTYIADVGNGASWASPVPLQPGVHGDLQVHRDGDLWWTSVRRSDKGWQREWAWVPLPRQLADYTQRCRFQEHDPASHFVARRLAVLATERGRISLVNGLFTEIVDGQRRERPVEPDEERRLLAQRFGIVLDRSWHPLPVTVTP
jgi:N-hydroxyarylamine O-acetyltransferase